MFYNYIAAIILILFTANLKNFLLLLNIPGGHVDQIYIGFLLILATALWANKNIPNLTASIFVLLALVFYDVENAALAFNGFSGRAIWLFFSFSIIAYAISESNLHRRMALALLKISRGNVKLISLIALLIIDISLFIIPIGMARLALFFPIFEEVNKTLYYKENSNFLKCVFIGSSILSTAGSSALMIAGASTILSVEIFDQVLGMQWSYINWLAAFFPVVFIYTFIFWFILLRYFSFENKDSKSVYQELESQLKNLGPVTQKEKKVLIIIGITVTLLLFGDGIGFSSLAVSLISVFLLMIPPYEIDCNKSIKFIDWTTIVFFGTIISMVIFFEKVGLTTIISEFIFKICSGSTINDNILFLISILFFLLLRIFLSSNVLYVGIVLPVIFELAPMLGINPIWGGMLAHLIGNGLILLPSQSPQVMFAFRKVNMAPAQVARVGIPAFIIFGLISLLLAYTYWPLLGYTINI